MSSSEKISSAGIPSQTKKTSSPLKEADPLKVGFSFLIAQVVVGVVIGFPNPIVQNCPHPALLSIFLATFFPTSVYMLFGAVSLFYGAKAEKKGSKIGAYALIGFGVIELLILGLLLMWSSLLNFSSNNTEPGICPPGFVGDVSM